MCDIVPDALQHPSIGAFLTLYGRTEISPRFARLYSFLASQHPRIRSTQKAPSATTEMAMRDHIRHTMDFQHHAGRNHALFRLFHRVHTES